MNAVYLNISPMDFHVSSGFCKGYVVFSGRRGDEAEKTRKEVKNM